MSLPGRIFEHYVLASTTGGLWIHGHLSVFTWEFEVELLSRHVMAKMAADRG